MFLNNGVGIQGKTKSRSEQEEPGRSYCDFLMFVHQRTRGILDTNMVRYFDRIHKSVRWPCTYDNTDYSWRTRLTVRPQDFHSCKRGSIPLPATN